jgi:3,4-dihydroxy 2-butanone 4-phosphate synthase / GTP cyclohydrolase II
MARWGDTRAVSLLLAPDARRTGHPSVDLEPERRPLADLIVQPSAGQGDRGSASPTCPLLNLTPGAFIVWADPEQARP